MSGCGFESITQALCFTDQQAQYNDCFHDFVQMIDAFDYHYMQYYAPGWISCIDKIMFDWLYKYCPGWMFIPRKPYPFGNEHYTI